MCKHFFFCIPSPAFVVYLLDDSHFNRCEVISPCGFDLHFPDDLWCWAFFFYVPIDYLGVLFGKMFSAHFEIILFAFLNYWIIWVFNIFEYWLLIWICCAKNLFPWMPFKLVNYFFCYAKCFKLGVVPYAFGPVSYSFYYYGLLILFEIRKCDTSAFVSTRVL